MDFERKVAEYAAGILPSEEAPQIANALIDRGVSHPSLAELVSMRQPTWRDARELFEEGVTAAGLRIPSVDDAQRMILHWTLAAITARKLAPEAGAERIWKHWHKLGIPHDQAVSELLVLSELWGERPVERSAIEASILEVVAALQVRYPKPSGLTIAEADKAP